jgi:hypothetical protein
MHAFYNTPKNNTIQYSRVTKDSANTPTTVRVTIEKNAARTQRERSKKAARTFKIIYIGINHL